DRLAQQHARQGRGDEGKRHVPGEPHAAGVASEEPAHHLNDARPIEPEHRQDRTALDDDQVGVERILRVRPIEAQQRRGEDEMPRRAHREVLRDALHQPQHDRLPPREHYISITTATITLPSTKTRPAVTRSARRAPASSSSSTSPSSRRWQPAAGIPTSIARRWWRTRWRYSPCTGTKCRGRTRFSTSFSSSCEAC